MPPGPVSCINLMYSFSNTAKKTVVQLPPVFDNLMEILRVCYLTYSYILFTLVLRRRIAWLS